MSESNERKRVLSCIQPTGRMHFGNYFGAVENWIRLQKDYECFFGVVDYHAMTVPFVPNKLRTNTWDMIFNLVATGVEPNTLFIQSLVPEHAELCWILNCFASYGQLSRMTQFKDKSQNQKGDDNFISVGLLDYPVLQAADILIYRAHFVPVGKDQEQHLELTRNIAQRFNNQVGKEYLVMPDSLYTKTSKINSTADPTRKMSKSAGEKHFIDIFEDEARIRKQVRSAVTDTGEPDPNQMSPGVENLFSLLEAAGRVNEHAQLINDYNAGTLKYVELKDAVADGLIALSSRFRERRAELNADKKALKQQIKESSHRIRLEAQETLKNVKELSGLLNVRY